jgi:hypothetical protein
MEKPAADEEEAMKKPWLSDPLPELHALSAPDVCYGSEAVCVLAFTPAGADGKPSKRLRQILARDAGADPATELREGAVPPAPKSIREGRPRMNPSARVPPWNHRRPR